MGSGPLKDRAMPGRGAASLWLVLDLAGAHSSNLTMAIRLSSILKNAGDRDGQRRQD